MRQIRDKDLAELLIQVRFAPASKRQKQVERAEQLLDMIQKDGEYPFEFVCFKITGFRPKGDEGRRLIRGDGLAEDLRIFIWKLSGQVAPSVQEQGEEVYSREQLAEKLDVSTKTIDRWRKRGLRARKFVFEDGRKRLGFLRSAADKFFVEHAALAEKAKRFVRLSAKQKQEIIERASALSSQGNMSRHRIIQRIAQETGRGKETIRYVLLSYQKTNPDKAGRLRQAVGQLSPSEAAEIDRLYREGAGIRELMNRFEKSRSSVYRILKQRRIQALLARKIEFIESDEFLRSDAEREILGDKIDMEQSGEEETGVLLSLRDGHSLGEYLEGLKNTLMLNRQQEKEFFRKYNYLKYRVFKAREHIGSGVSSSRLDEIERFLAEAEAVKRIIIEANLRLVVSIANKHTITGANLADLVSEGNVLLMQAVEKFDYRKGFRFATYAGWAISKDLAHMIPGQRARAKREEPAMSRIQEELKAGAVDVSVVERARHDLIQVIRDNLERREQYIIVNHFGLEGTLVKKNKKTLKQIGDDLGLSKERVRQIELAALQKLRQSLSKEQFDLLKG